ncbi:hypothetical protein HII13_001152 [Brettanomyces bruxellensis]|nr:hypothetical protein HII13_001152 [Brettanomyces bruxellensis]
MDLDLKLVTDLSTVQDYLKGILWTIFFHRLFGQLTPEDGKNYLGVPYPVFSCPDLASLIDSKASTIWEELSSQSDHISGHDADGDDLLFKCVIVIKFYKDSVSVDNSIQKQAQDYLPSLSSRSNSRSESSSSVLPQRTRKYEKCWERCILKVTILNNKHHKVSKRDYNTHTWIRAKTTSLQFHQWIFSPFPYKVLFALNTHDPASLSTAFASFESLPGKGSISGNVEFVTTPESGDIIVGGTSMTDSDPGTRDGTHINIPSGEELLRNGYNFLRKFLE